MSDRIVLVTGATGAIGPKVVRCLYEAGYGVRTLSLDQFQPSSSYAGIRSFVGDVTDASAVQAAMQGVDSVIHLAALLHIVNPPPALQEKSSLYPFPPKALLGKTQFTFYPFPPKAVLGKKSKP